MSALRPADAIAQELGGLAARPYIAHALSLLGQPGSAQRIPTPAAVLDLDAFDRNVARMAGRAAWRCARISSPTSARPWSIARWRPAPSASAAQSWPTRQFKSDIETAVSETSPQAAKGS